MWLLILVAFLALSAFTHLGAMFFTGRLIGHNADMISLGAGPRLGKWTFGTTELELRLFPIAGFVSWGEAAFDKMSRFEGTIIPLSGLCATAFLALASGTNQVNYTDPIQAMIKLAWSPFEYGEHCHTYLKATLSSNPLHVLSGTATVLTVANALPIPAACGGQIMLQLLGWQTPKPFWMTIGTICTICLFFVWCMWFVALVAMIF